VTGVLPTPQLRTAAFLAVLRAEVATPSGKDPTQPSGSGRPATGDVLLSPPTAIGRGPSSGGRAVAQHDVADDDQQIAFMTGDVAPGPGEAHIYRVTASQQGQVFDGYTVVLLS
jgi:hypothetical protein